MYTVYVRLTAKDKYSSLAEFHTRWEAERRIQYLLLLGLVHSAYFERSPAQKVA